VAQARTTTGATEVPRARKHRYWRFRFRFRHLLLAAFLVWYAYQWYLSPPLIWAYTLQVASTVLSTLLYISISLLHFVALFWFLGRGRTYWIDAGETGVTFRRLQGKRRSPRGGKRIVTLLKGVKKFKEMGGEVSKGLLLVGPPGTGNRISPRPSPKKPTSPSPTAPRLLSKTCFSGSATCG